jgi:hypothetical protein
MANRVSVEVKGRAWQKLQDVASIVGDVALEALEEAMWSVCDAVQRDMMDYPPPRREPLPAVYPMPHMRNGYPTGTMYMSKFKTFKQQRYFFWALREGLIQVPYRRKRSAGLRGAFHSEVWREGASVVGAVGVNEDYAPYARYVIGNDDEQAEYHKGHWPQLEERAPEVARKYIDAAVNKAVDRLIDRLI